MADPSRPGGFGAGEKVDEHLLVVAAQTDQRLGAEFGMDAVKASQDL